jgi:hypothetical protein
MLVEWLPKIGVLITGLFGLVGFFKPHVFTKPMNIALQSPVAVSEARVVFGALNLGMALAALILADPIIYTAMGIAWGTAFLARIWSIFTDSIAGRDAVPGLLVDGVLSTLLLSPVLLS